jgi:hypothetical protein
MTLYIAISSLDQRESKVDDRILEPTNVYMIVVTR